MTSPSIESALDGSSEGFGSSSRTMLSPASRSIFDRGTVNTILVFRLRRTLTDREGMSIRYLPSVSGAKNRASGA